MHWQDIVLAAGAITFSIALFPSVLSKDKPALSTSVMTGTVLIIFAYVYFTLSLWFSTLTTAITGVIWFILAAQKLKKSNNLS